MKSEIKLIDGISVKWKGIFDLEELYQNIKYWLDYNSYGDHKKNFQEKAYVERIKGDSKQMEIKWVAQKDVGDYFAYVLEIGFNIPSIVEVETEVDGRKIKSNSGSITIKISATLVKDRQNKWNSKFMQDLYERFIVKERIEDHKIGISKQAYSLHDEIKDYLTMHKY